MPTALSNSLPQAMSNAMPKAMILSAGRGLRMRELTANCPKPLLKVAGKPLIDYRLEALACAGIIEVVINLGYLGEQIADYCGDGTRYGLHITYSIEPQTGLETGGGVEKALPLLGDAAFILTNADIFCDFDYRQLLPITKQLDEGLNTGLAKETNLLMPIPTAILAHLVLVNNPDFKPTGDFSLQAGSPLTNAAGSASSSTFPQQLLCAGHDWTFSGISVLHPQLFYQFGQFDQTKPNHDPCYPIAPIWRAAMQQQQISADVFTGSWNDIGTPERLLNTTG